MRQVRVGVTEFREHSTKVGIGMMHLPFSVDIERQALPCTGAPSSIAQVCRGPRRPEVKLHEELHGGQILSFDIPESAKAPGFR